MKTYAEMSREELLSEKASLEERYNEFKARGLKLDMSRGKPCKEQLDLSVALNDVADYVSDGVDVRNYGMLDGIPSCKKLFADLMGVKPENVIVGPTSSLNLMFDYVSQCYTHGAGSTPWCKLDKVKFLCPVPGYDRHFTILEHFGIEMINVDMKQDGPDMDAIEELVKDPSVKGMFCVPKYSNPQGITFSDDVVRRIAALKPAAEDFRIVWDNAYCVHDLVEDGDKLLNILMCFPNTATTIWLLKFAQLQKSLSPAQAFLQ